MSPHLTDLGENFKRKKGAYHMKNKELGNDIPKYKKKTKSNCSKSKSKSDHKHQNEDCLLIADSNPYLASYCTVCGKIRGWNYCLEKCEGGYRELPKEEVYSKYKDLEQIAVKDLFVKYVPLTTR